MFSTSPEPDPIHLHLPHVRPNYPSAQLPPGAVLSVLSQNLKLSPGPLSDVHCAGEFYQCRDRFTRRLLSRIGLVCSAVNRIERISRPVERI